MIRRVLSYIVVLLLGVGLAVCFGRGLPTVPLRAIAAGALAIVALLGIVWLKS